MMPSRIVESTGPYTILTLTGHVNVAFIFLTHDAELRGYDRRTLEHLKNYRIGDDPITDEIFDMLLEEVTEGEGVWVHSMIVSNLVTIDVRTEARTRHP